MDIGTVSTCTLVQRHQVHVTPSEGQGEVGGWGYTAPISSCGEDAQGKCGGRGLLLCMAWGRRTRPFVVERASAGKLGMTCYALSGYPSALSVKRKASMAFEALAGFTTSANAPTTVVCGPQVRGLRHVPMDGHRRERVRRAPSDGRRQRRVDAPGRGSLPDGGRSKASRARRSGLSGAMCTAAPT